MSEELLIPIPGPFGDNGNFLLERELGRGGMGGVYMGRDKMLDRPVAVKVMLKEYGSDPEFVEKFKREAQAVARLIHPNIAQVYSYGFSSGMPYIAMELVAGGSLDSLMKTHGKNIDIPRVMKICEQVAQALRCAADQGLVHGDVKPENILLDANGNAKLVDFGLAAMQKNTDEIWGTPYYIAPEKVKKQPVDYRADMYSLGGTLYHALTGQSPFEGDDAIAVIKARFQGAPKKPSEIRPGISKQVDFLVMKMLELDPANRYPTFEALLEDYKKVMATGLNSTQSLDEAVGSGAAAETETNETSGAPTATTKIGGKKLVMKGKKKLAMKKPGAKPVVASSAEDEKPEGDESTSQEDGVAPVLFPEGKKQNSGDDEEEDGGMAFKVVGVVLGVILTIGALIGGLVWYKVADAKARAAEEQAQVMKGIRTSRNSMAKTREAIVKFADEFDVFSEEAVKDCQKYTDELKKILAPVYSQNVLDMLKPGPTKELLDAIASTNVVVKVEPPLAPAIPPAAADGAATNAAPAKAQAQAAAPAPAEAAPAETPAAPAEAAADAAPTEEVPAAVRDMAGLWEKAYSCLAGAIRVRAAAVKIVADIDAAEQINGTDLETMRKLEAISNDVKDRYESIRASKDVENAQKAKGFIASRGKKTIEQTVRRMREEAAQKARAEAAAAEAAAEKERLENAKKEREEKVAAEIQSAKDKFELLSSGRVFAQLDWTSAKRQLTSLGDDFKTPEGEIALKNEIRKVEAMETVHKIFIRNLKDFTFAKGKKGAKSLKGATCTAVDAKEISLVRAGKTIKVSWPMFYRDYHENLNELLNKFIRRGRENGNPKLRLSEHGDALLGAALTMRLICSDDPSALGFGEQLAKETVKAYPSYFKRAKEFFPDIDFSDVAAEVAAEEI